MKGLSTPTMTSTPLCPKFVEWLKFDTCDDPQLIKVALACQDWAYALKDSARPRWLSILGVSGTGKTHCASRLWNYANGRLKGGWTVTRSGFHYHQDTAYIPHKIFWPDFVQRLRTGAAYELRDDMKRWPVLFLDDIGAERDASGFAAEELNTLLAMRMGKWTLITSNKDFNGLKNVDARIASRLIRNDNICVSINTLDYAARTK